MAQTHFVDFVYLRDVAVGICESLQIVVVVIHHKHLIIIVLIINRVPIRPKDRVIQVKIMVDVQGVIFYHH